MNDNYADIPFLLRKMAEEIENKKIENKTDYVMYYIPSNDYLYLNSDNTDAIHPHELHVYLSNHTSIDDNKQLTDGKTKPLTNSKLDVLTDEKKDISLGWELYSFLREIYLYADIDDCKLMELQNRVCDYFGLSFDEKVREDDEDETL